MTDNLQLQYNDETTITFDRAKLYNHDKTMAAKTIVELLGNISGTRDKADRLDTLAALAEYGVHVWDHYQASDGTWMHGPVPVAGKEIK